MWPISYLDFFESIINFQKWSSFLCTFLYSSAINFAIHLLSNLKSLVWYGSPCIGFLLGPRLHVILCPQHEKESAKPEIQKVVAHFPYLHQNGSLKKINWSLVVIIYMYVLCILILCAACYTRWQIIDGIIRAWEHLMDAYVIYYSSEIRVLFLMKFCHSFGISSLFT